MSYERLNELSRSVRTWSYGGPEWELARRITNECARTAADISNDPQGLSNLDRARLLDIAIWASELGRSLRRDLRRRLSIPIRLIAEAHNGGWQEDTQTIDVSRCGAQTSCKHAVEIGEILTLARMDTPEQAKVRVVWHRRRISDVEQIGVEIIDDSNEKLWD
jgi:hypothetical protein